MESMEGAYRLLATAATAYRRRDDDASVGFGLPLFRHHQNLIADHFEAVFG